MKELKRKLSSRKFWLALAGLVSAIAVAFGAAEATVAQLTAIIMAGGVIAAYILGESYVDANK